MKINRLGNKENKNLICIGDQLEKGFFLNEEIHISTHQTRSVIGRGNCCRVVTRSRHVRRIEIVIDVAEPSRSPGCSKYGE